MTDYEQAYRDLRAGVEALADEWDGYGHGVYCTHLEDQLPCGTCTVLARIRALLASSAPATASQGPTEALRRAVGVRLAQEFERKNASQKPDVYMADTWLFAADAALNVIAARPTRDEFRARVRSILVDRAALDEHIEEFFDEVLDDIVEAHLSHPTLTGVTSSDGDWGLSEDEREAIYRAGDHGPSVCDCSAYVVEQAFAEDDCCQALLDTFAAVERILAARAAQPEGVEWEYAFGQKLRRRAPGPWEVVGDE